MRLYLFIGLSVGLILCWFVNSAGAPVSGSVGQTHWQTAFSDLVPCHAPSYPGKAGCEASNQKIITNATSVFTWRRELLPYTVPPGKELHITDVVFGSKHVCYQDQCRNSYLTISGFPTVTELGPNVSLSTPFIIPSGITIEVSFINNSPEPQWMNGMITGWLVDTTFSVASTATVTAATATPIPSPTSQPVATATVAVPTPTKTPTPVSTPGATPTPWWCRFIACA